MPHHQFMAKLQLDEAELRSRRAFFEITDADLERLAGLRPFAEKYTDEIITRLYELILGHAESRRLFTDDKMIRHVQAQQRQYFHGLFSGRCDLAYVEDRLRIGVAHERSGIPPKFYIGAYRRYLADILDCLTKELNDPAEVILSYQSIKKLVAFDMALAMDTYFASHLETLARHQAAIREMSTPVIQVHKRILLLPLVGAIDTQRAEQIMESVLLKVVEHQARVIIIEIAGVAVVDTRVADHLLKTTEAVRLLGAATILTGISPTVAKTIVNLGMDISAMHTRNNLADGIELALELDHEWRTRKSRSQQAEVEER